MATSDHDGDGRRSMGAPWIVAAACLAVVVAEIPALRTALGSQPSLHAGAAVDDAGTEACIDRLWQLSALVRQGESADVIAGLGVTDPVTDAPYAVSRDERGVVVACPNPAAHGLTRLRITEAAPMPEALR
jgi:hypothetical protein